MRIVDGSFPAGSEAAVAQAFVRAGAVSSATAVTLEELGLTGTLGAASLQRRELLRTTDAGRAYLDLVHYRHRVTRYHLRRFFVLVVMLSVLAALCWRAIP